MNACPDIGSVLQMTPASGIAYFSEDRTNNKPKQWALPIVGFGVVVNGLYDDNNKHDWRPASGRPPILYSTVVQPMVMDSARFITPLNHYLALSPTTQCRVVLDK